MFAYEGRAELRWEANSSLTFVVGVELVVLEARYGWDARLRCVDDTGEEADSAHEWLLALDSPYTLTFPDSSVYAVSLSPAPKPPGGHAAADSRWFAVEAWTG